MNNDKLNMQSVNGTAINIENIAALFPHCVTETAEGKRIDFDLLKQELSNEIVEGNKERYRLEWPGKREAIVTANTPINKTLRPVREDSVDFDKTENIYIEGDNLEVLKLLQESYLGKIKMIYIDPPYNTGKDFVYKDNFAKSSEEELFESGQKDEYGQRLQANPETSGRYHSDWLSMMYPRLKLARNLLTEDGVIFISIDDNEVHNLRKICDEIFGEGNFVVDAVWRSKDNSNNDAKKFSIDHNHTLVYARNVDWQPIKIKDETKQKHFKNPDNDPNGPYFDGNPLNSPNYRENLIYELISPNGNVISPPKNGWRWSKEQMDTKIKSGEIRFNENETNIRRRTYLKDMEGLPPSSLLIDLEKTGHNRQAKYELLKLIPEDIFDTPKPTKLIQYIVKLSTSSNDIVLDFFSGSSTTAHAVMQLNAEDGGNRKYIMVQLPEATDEKSEAYKAGYKNICEIGKERIRRAAKKIKEDTNADIDYGFRVFRLDTSNVKDVFYTPQGLSQASLDLFADNVKDDRTAEDLVAQIMLDWGLELSLPIERKTVLGKEVYAVAGDSLYCCFDQEIDEAFAKEIAKDQPMRIVFLDNSFKDDTAKENVKQLLKQLTPNTEMRVV